MTASQAINSRIVSVLEEYGQIPEDFLARRVSRRTPEIQDFLADLERRGVIWREKGSVSLAGSEKKVGLFSRNR